MQFVNFTEIMSRNVPLPQKEAEFALAALMEIPLQYRATLELQLLRYLQFLTHISFTCINFVKLKEDNGSLSNFLAAIRDDIAERSHYHHLHPAT